MSLSCGNDGVCKPANCHDKVKNPLETCLDGGQQACPNTQRCAHGDGCMGDGDCLSGKCTNGVCAAPKCDDFRQNQDEVCIDAGGSTCVARCATGKRCVSHSDCVSNICEHSGTHNSTNLVAGVCGAVPAVAATMEVTQSSLYSSLMSSAQNGGLESFGVESLSVIPPPLPPPSSCTDGKKSGNESDVDCGSACAVASDATSGITSASFSKLCLDSKTCFTHADCESKRCFVGTCSPATCSDGIRNGQEVCIDGGGVCDQKCDLTSDCNDNDDCLSGLCSTALNKCIDSLCSNGQHDSIINESFVDCGGPICGACAINATCNTHSDCLSLSCHSGLCQVASCFDQLLNNKEVDVDCGRFEETACPSLCEAGQKCRDSHDCANTTVCGAGICKPLTALTEIADQQKENEQLKREQALLLEKANALGHGVFEFDKRTLVLHERKGLVWHNISVFRTFGSFGKVSVAVVAKGTESTGIEHVPKYQLDGNNNSVLILPTSVPDDKHASGIHLHEIQRLHFAPGDSLKHVLVAVMNDNVWTNPETPRHRTLQFILPTGGATIGYETTQLIVKEIEPPPQTSSPTTPSPKDTEKDSSEKVILPDKSSSIQVTLSMSINAQITTMELKQPKVIKDMELRLANVLGVDVKTVTILDIYFCPDIDNKKCNTAIGRGGRRRMNADKQEIFITFVVKSTEQQIQSIETTLQTTDFKASLDSAASSSLSNSLNKNITVNTNSVVVVARTGGTPSPSSLMRAGTEKRDDLWFVWIVYLVCAVLLLSVVGIVYKKSRKRSKIKAIDGLKVR